MLRRAGIVLVLVAAMAGGCGSPSLPDPGECPEFRAFESSVLQERAYLISVSRELEAILELDNGFRSRWTERRIRELDSFRADFVTYAHLTACRVEFMLDIDAPPLAPEAFVARLEIYGDEVLEAMEDGRDAVATRNNSDYRDWVRTIDGLMEDTRALLDEARGGV